MSDHTCKNGCVTPLRFPRRPGENPPTLHGDDCFCCDANELVSADNRPALPHFNYRIGTYGTIREWLLHQINQTPTLKNWTHRAPDDPAIALLEGASILGDILTFYQETYANEAFLRTAKWRESIADLVRLLGYRLSPGLGGKATFAFEIKKDEPVVIPAGFPLKATLEMPPKPSDFETIDEITAYPWLSSFNLYRPLEDGDITPQTTEFYISWKETPGELIDLKVGDRLLIGQTNLYFALGWGGELTNVEIVIIDSIREQHGRKYYTIKGKLKRTTNISSLFAYKIGRTFHHFGHNSAPKIVNTGAAVTSSATVNGQTTTTTSTIPYLTVPLSRPVNTSFDSFSAPVDVNLSDRDFPIDSELKDLATNTPIIIQAPVSYPNLAYIIGQPYPLQTVVRMIADVRTVNMTWGSISGTISQLKLNAELGLTLGNTATMWINGTLFHEGLSSGFRLSRSKRDTTAASGSQLYFYGKAGEVKTLKDRRLMIAKPGEDPLISTVTSVPAMFDAGSAASPQLHQITLSDTVTYADFPNDSPTVTVYGNLADANEGKRQPEVVLGSGDATQVFQNFKVPKLPLTYHIVAENTPPETPEVEIYVDGRMWTKVDSFFGRASDEQIYIIREDAAGNSWVQFGDGKTGARLTTGVKNVTAIYRMGSGAFGALKADTKVQAGAKIKNLDKIQMPQVAAGGSEPEDGENARYAAPGKVQSLGRIVSQKDFESEAIAISGVAAASAAWALIDNVPGVVVTVMMETGRNAELESVADALRSYNVSRGAARFSVSTELGKRRYVTASVHYALKGGFRADLVEPEIRRALGVNFARAAADEDQTGLFSLRRRKLGLREYASTIEGVTQNVDGVLWAKVVAFEEMDIPTTEPDLSKFNEDDPETYIMPSTSVLSAVVPCSRDRILSLYDKHLFLTAISGGEHA